MAAPAGNSRELHSNPSGKITDGDVARFQACRPRLADERSKAGAILFIPLRSHARPLVRAISAALWRVVDPVNSVDN